jgi:hypothetical protein
MADIRIERVVVTGGRNFTDYERIEADLRALLPLGLSRVAEGECPFGGADELAYDAWHLLRNECTQRYPRDRRLDGPGKPAYLRRNIRMLEAEKPDLVLAYPDPTSKGTWHCVAEAVKRGFPVAVWVGHAHSQNRAEMWVAAGLAHADMRAPVMVVNDLWPRVIVAKPPAHMDGAAVLEVLRG